MTKSSGVKHDQGKAPMSLLDRHALEQISAVLAFGAAKYAAHNWRGGIAYSRLTDAALRHLFAFADGEDNDAESGLPHLAHAGCCIMFLLGMTNTRPDMDDRYKKPANDNGAACADCTDIVCLKAGKCRDAVTVSVEASSVRHSEKDRQHLLSVAGGDLPYSSVKASMMLDGSCISPDLNGLCDECKSAGHCVTARKAGAGIC